MERTEKTIIDNIEDRNVSNQNITSFESLGGASIDYKTFFELVDVYAKAFLELGVQNNDIVTICTGGTLDTLLAFAGLNKIGAVAQYVNPNYFKYNSTKYINGANSKLLICLDRFYPLLKNSIAETNVERVMLSSISEYSSFLFKVLARRKKIEDKDKIDGIKYIELPEFVKLGENSNLKIERLPYEPDKPAVITYTSGTTGNPKGVVHTNDSINNMIMMYEYANGFGAHRGDRSLVLIPPMYLTSFVHSIIAPMSLGASIVMQPIYNPYTFGKDIKKYHPCAVVASKAHYLNLSKSNLPRNSLSNVVYAYCGGEAISKATAIKINEILEYFGIQPMIIGYGQTEFGTMVMFSNGILGRTNESGILIPGAKAKIVDLNGREVERGQSGELLVQTPAMMKEYFRDAEATKKYFVIDDNGEKWAKSGDIAKISYQYNGRDVYEVSGRKNDSFIDKEGNVVYLFEIETEIESIKYIKEAEVIALTIDDIKVPIVHIILEKNANCVAEDVLKLVDNLLRSKFKNPNAIPYAYKIRKSFDTSPISGKRNSAILKYEMNGYLKRDDDGNFKPASFASVESTDDNQLIKSKIMLKK